MTNNTKTIRFINVSSLENAVKKFEEDTTEVIKGIAKYLNLAVNIEKGREEGLSYWDDDRVKLRDLTLMKVCRKILYLNTVSNESGFGYFLTRKVNLNSFEDCNKLVDSVWQALYDVADKQEASRKVRKVS